MLGVAGLVDRGMSVHELRGWAALLLWGGFEWLWYKIRHGKAQELEVPFDARAGYYRLCDGAHDACFATVWEKEKIPTPHQELYPPPLGTVVYIGKIHCIIDGRFWVWTEYCAHPRVPEAPSSHPFNDI